jgi:hypothetical protein
MGRIARLRWRALCCAALMLAMGGCPGFKKVHLQLTAFGSGDVDGIWLWRQGSSGSYTRLCRFQISNPYPQGGVELVSYDQLCLDGSLRTIPMQAQIVRTAADPNTITVRLEYQPGNRAVTTFRATAYNAAGESGLSSGVIRL